MELKRNISVVIFMVASTIGAGIFALPFVLATHGIVTFGLFMMVSVWAMIRVHDAVVQLSASTHKNLQIPGLIQRYLGRRIASFTGFIFFLGEFIALLIYTLGLFEIFSLLIPGLSFATVAIFCLIFAGISGGMGERFALRNSFLFSSLVFFLVLVISLLCVLHPDFLLTQTFPVLINTPVSIIAVCFFALSGIVAIPELASMVRDRVSLRFPVAFATSMIALLYIFFSIAVVGLLQQNTTTLATAGLQFHFGMSAVVLVFVVTVASFCSGLMLRSLSLVESLRWDYGFSKRASLILFLGFFGFLLLLPARSFTQVVSLSGGIIGGLLGILIMSAFMRMKYQQVAHKRFIHIYSFFPIVLVIVICFLALFRVV